MNIRAKDDELDSMFANTLVKSQSPQANNRVMNMRQFKEFQTKKRNDVLKRAKLKEQQQIEHKKFLLKKRDM